MHNSSINLTVANLNDSIQTIKQYLHEPDIQPLLSSLEALKEDIENESLLTEFIEAWRNLGVYQGAVLTYLPHFYTLIPDDIFGENG